MKEYKSLHGFNLVGTTDCPEQSATLVEYRHEKTGAPLYYLDRPDKNMTFAIGFRTVPTDDTGVFHILEHSVLCGSEKYPIKDPFSELLKGSLSTYLNALTYGEHTVYPVSSLNKKSFLNLIDVYLDATLHPLALKNENIFLQEGHRLEFTADGSLAVNGIVYNEMRGAYSSPDELSAYYEGRLLYPGGCYSYDSGGNPDAIPSLSYGQFLAAHAKYYHPSNSILFLDGEVELEAVLALINSYLSEYGAGECFLDVPRGGEMITEPLCVEYPVSGDEGESGTRIILTRPLCEHSDKLTLTTVALIADAIADSNSAPLKKRILDSGLCNNFAFFPVTGMKYPSLVTKFLDVKEGCEEELVALFHTALDEILDTGVDRKSILATLNATEFALREADFGSYPRGMVYMASVMEDAVCGEHPSSGLSYNALYANLREKLDTPHYEDTLKAVMQGGEATLILRPSLTVMQEREAEEERVLSERLAAMTDEEKAAVADKCSSLAEWQNTPDTEEVLATVPTLSLSDLERECKRVPREVYELDGTTVVSHPLPTGGISYLDLYFDLSDLSLDDIHALGLFALCLSEFGTDDYSPTEFSDRIKTNLGTLCATINPIQRGDEVRLYLQYSLSTLDTGKAIATDILREYLYTRKFDNAQALTKRVEQLLKRRKEALIASATRVCIGRGAASFSALEAVKEHVGGLEFVKYVKTVLSEGKVPELLEKFRSITDKYLTRSRLTVSVTGTPDTEFVRAAIGVVKEGGTRPTALSIELLERKNIGIVIPAAVSYATLMTNFITEGAGTFHGSFSPLGTILSLELLWNEIRVKGGAYDTSFLCRGISGTLGFYSYRDPSPDRSISVFRSITDLLRDFLATNPDLTKYVIGMIGQTDTVTTPRSEGADDMANYLKGVSYEYLNARRAESIDATVDDLYRAAEIIDRSLGSAVAVIAGPKERLLAMELDEIIEI